MTIGRPLRVLGTLAALLLGTQLTLAQSPLPPPPPPDPGPPPAPIPEPPGGENPPDPTNPGDFMPQDPPQEDPHEGAPAAEGPGSASNEGPAPAPARYDCAGDAGLQAVDAGGVDAAGADGGGQALVGGAQDGCRASPRSGLAAVAALFALALVALGRRRQRG